jgi:hypothetical protein
MIRDTVEMRRYVTRWFADREQFQTMTGCAAGALDTLLAAGCAPGPIYALHADGWWSALGRSRGLHGRLPAHAVPYYSRGAAWWVRRAVLLTRAGIGANECAAANAGAFEQQFLSALATEPLAASAFADCFVHGKVDANSAARRAATEWSAWVAGGYAVCLHHFTGSSCVLKEALAHVLRQGLGAGERHEDREGLLGLLDDAHRLSGLILPFSPEERSAGTPGQTIDRLLAEQRLGEMMPFDG